MNNLTLEEEMNSCDASNSFQNGKHENLDGSNCNEDLQLHAGDFNIDNTSADKTTLDDTYCIEGFQSYTRDFSTGSTNTDQINLDNEGPDCEIIVPKKQSSSAEVKFEKTVDSDCGLPAEPAEPGEKANDCNLNENIDEEECLDIQVKIGGPGFVGRRGFTSEIFKIEITNLPRKFGFTVSWIF